MLKDKEVQRLVQYAKASGLTVTFKQAIAGAGIGGEYDGVNKEITVYTHSALTNADVILVLLHELGHHLDFIYKGKRDANTLLEALTKEDERKLGDEPIPKHFRQYIYDCEVAGTYYMPVLARELDLKIPLWKVEAEKLLDRWIAKRYLLSGDTPPIYEIRAMRTRLRKKLKERV